MKYFFLLTLAATLVAGGCGNTSRSNQRKLKIDTIAVNSLVFKNNHFIPQKFTCYGAGISPPLSFGHIPKAAKSLVLIIYDPEAPSDTFYHWLLWDISPKMHHINTNSIPKRAIQGINSAGQIGYFSPCPPLNVHHYHFKIMAIDNQISLPEKATIQQLQSAIKEHVIAWGELIGRVESS